MSGLYTAGTVQPAPVRRALPGFPALPVQQNGSRLRAMCSVKMQVQDGGHLPAMCIGRLPVQTGGRITAPGIFGSSHGDSLPQNKRSRPVGRSEAGRPVSRRATGRINSPGGRAGLGNRRVQGGRAVTSVPGETCSIFFPLSQPSWPRCSFFFSSVGGF
jgi:hypothetical protein